MNLKLKYLYTLTVLFLYFPSIFSQNYYVDATSGNDNNTGTSINSPWKTISKVNSFQFGAGSTIHFKRGEQWRETLTIDRSGTQNNPITFTNYGSGHLPIIYGSRKLTGWVASGSQFRVAHTAANIFFESSIDNMRWGNRKNSQTAVTGNYDFYVGGGYTYVKDTTYYSIESPQRTNGIYVSSGVKYVVIDGIDIRHAIEGGIEGRNVWYSIIQNCYSWYNGAEFDELGEGIYWIAGKYNIIRGNIIKDNSVHGIYCSVFNESNVDSAVGNIIEYNKIGNHYHTMIDLMNTGGGSNNVHHYHYNTIVRYNYIYTDADYNLSYACEGIQMQGNVAGGGAAYGDQVKRVQIYGNVIENLVRGAGILSAWYTDSIWVYNNTIVNTQKGLAFSQSHAGVHAWIKNNIFHVNQPNYTLYLATTTNKEVDNNLYFHTSTTIWNIVGSSSYSGTNGFTNYRNATGWDANGYNTNPLFLGSGQYPYSLALGSVGIDAGVNVGLTHDILGNPISGIPDIGAYEYQSGLGDITPPQLLGATVINPSLIELTFSESIQQLEAQTTNNYSINGGIVVNSATLIGTDKVRLQTTIHQANQDYTVVVSNVKDLAGNIISGTNNSAIYGYTADTTPPELVSAEIVDSVTVRLLFSEAMDQISSELESNYAVTGGILVNQANLLTDGKTVRLSTSTHQPNTTYTIAVTDVMDLAGNIISNNANSFLYEYINPLMGIVQLPVSNAVADRWYLNYTPEKSIDGLPNGDSRWGGAHAMPDTILYCLGDIQILNQSKISFYEWNNGRTYNYTIQVSTDSLNWLDLRTNIPSFSEEWSIESFNPTEAKFIRVISLTNNQSVYAGIYEAEFWGHLKIVSNIGDDEEIPSSFTLFQNYPNPFNPTTNIKFSLPDQSLVKLSIYNILGELVEIIAHSEFSAGNYEFSFDGKELSSGIYFYTLETNSFRESKKMILQK